MKDVLLVHPYLRGHSGSEALAGWMIHALQDVTRLTVLSMEPIACAEMNQMFGTAIEPKRFRQELARGWLGRAIESVPLPLSLLAIALMQREVKALTARRRFDVVISTHNEADLGQRGIQYVHFPWASSERPPQDWRTYHRLPGAIAAYRRFCFAVGKIDWQRLRSNVTLANSSYTAGLIAVAHGIRAKVLYPPVPRLVVDPPPVRQDRFLYLGRIHQEKRVIEAMRIVERLRRHGHDVGFTAVGFSDRADYLKQLRQQAARHSGWARIATDIPMAQLASIVGEHRYGLHPMVNEHFGIAVATLMRAGCVTFAHNSGGPAEIIADERLLFDGEDDAVEKIEAVLQRPALREELRGKLETIGERFSAERFVAEVRQLVEEFDPLGR